MFWYSAARVELGPCSDLCVVAGLPATSLLCASLFSLVVVLGDRVQGWVGILLSLDLLNDACPPTHPPTTWILCSSYPSGDPTMLRVTALLASWCLLAMEWAPTVLVGFPRPCTSRVHGFWANLLPLLHFFLLGLQEGSKQVSPLTSVLPPLLL